jgi:formiminotetrahydrofolate cyclodeaminase
MAAEPQLEQTLGEYLDAVAAGTPVPGGGSVAAIVGALGAALGEMVVNLTGGREVETAGGALVEIGQRLTALRATLLAAAGDDEAAYAAYRAAADLPRGSADEKAARTQAMQAALLRATDVPLGVARAAAEIAELMERVATDGTPHLRTDAALGALLAETALRGALLNVRGNAAMLRDRESGNTYLTEAGRLEERGRAAAERAFGAAISPEGAPVR